MILAFDERAKRELDDAYRWYEDQAPGLGKRFVAQVEAVCARAVHAPRFSTEVAKDIHKAIVRRFPYLVFYLHDQQDLPDSSRLIIIAIAHMHRMPFYWADRV